MTLKQLRRTHRSYLAEFDRACERRRKYLVQFFAKQIQERKAAKNPNKSNTAHAVKLKKQMYNALYRSVMNKAGNTGCARWKRTRNGTWYTTKKHRCQA